MATSIIKCYDTEENALNGSATGLIASSTSVDSFPYAHTVNNIGNGIYNRADHVPFFIFNEYWFRFEFNDPATAIHIDWGDGEIDVKDGQNYELITFQRPIFFTVTSHIYSKLGVFWPLMRVENEQGFLSKWYTGDNNSGNYKMIVNPAFQSGAATVPHGAQNIYPVREESTSAIGGTKGFRIPHMRPANLPPVAILKTSTKRVIAGIDNEQIDFRGGQKPLMYAWSDSSAITNGGAASCNVKVTLEVEGEDDGQIKEYTIPIQLDDDIASGTWDDDDLRDDCAPSGAEFTAGALEVQKFTLGSGDTAGVDANGTPTAGSNSFNNKYLRISNSTTSSNFICTFFHPVVAQTYTLTINTDDPNQLGGSGDGTAAPYIDVYSSTGGLGTHRWWFNCAPAGNTAPSAPGVGLLEQIDLRDNQHDPDLDRNGMASLIATSINNGLTYGMSNTVSDQFTATSSSNVVTITNTTSAGTAWTATNLNTPTNEWREVTAGEAAGSAQSKANHTAISVEFTSGDSANTLAGLLATAINANANFTASANGGEVTFSPVITGNMTAPVSNSVNGSNTNNDCPGVTETTVSNGSGSGGSLNASRRLYKAKLSDIDTLGDNDRVYIKVHNFDLTTDGESYPSNTDPTVAVLSNGNPIVELNDPSTRALLDGGESLTRAGNVDIKEYYFDVDKNLLTTGASSHTTQNESNSVGELTGLFNQYFNNFKDSTKELKYTHHNTGFSTDSDGRFEKFSRLPRLQVKDNSEKFLLDTVFNEGDRITRSILDATDSKWPIGIHRIRLNARKSYTKGAKLTQASTNATGYVLHTTQNQNWVDVYNTSEISNHDGSGQAFTVSANNLVSDVDGDDDDGQVAAIAKGTLRIPYDFFEKGTNQFRLMTSNRSGISKLAANFTTETTQLDGNVSDTDTSIDVDSSSGMFIGDILRITPTGGTAEYMKITNISSNTLTVKRGYFGSTKGEPQNNVSVYRGSSNLVSATTLNDDGTNAISGGSTAAQTWSVSDWSTTNGFVNDMPENFILFSQQKKFNAVYLRTGHSFKPLIANGAANGPAKVKLSMWYSQSVPPNKDSAVNIYDWKPLPFIDNTNELRTSGTLSWFPPEDWAYCSDNDLCENNGTYATTDNWKGPILNDNAKTSSYPYYHILIGWSAKDDSNTDTDMAIQNIWPVTNSHSQVIDIIDPHHVSLNSIALAQSISYNRKGKFTFIDDRLGKTDIRRIGAEGGTVTFGGIDLGTDKTGRNKIKNYQANGTPVYLDITHGDDSKTRFFGVIISMSEDYPAGKMKPKWAVQMRCSYCIEMSSAGVMTSEKIALGGVVSDVAKYLLQS